MPIPRKVVYSSAAAVSTFSLWGLFGGGNKPQPDQSVTTSTSTSSSKLPVPGPNPSTPIKPQNPVDPAGYFSYGIPTPIHDLRTHDEFISCYDRRTRNPYWVIEQLTPESLKSNPNSDRKNSVFREDETIPFKFRAFLRDYFRSGYDRGHQAAAADAKFSQEAMDQTFYLSNMAPQVGEGFNRDYWAHLEDFTRRLTKKYPSVRVITGPLYLPKRFPDGKYRVVYEMIGNPPNIAVPTHFFKLVVAETVPTTLNEGVRGSVSVAAFVLPNDKISNTTPLVDFQVPVDALEKSSGVLFFDKLDSSINLKDLCKETNCDIIVRQFNDQYKKQLPSK